MIFAFAKTVRSAQYAVRRGVLSVERLALRGMSRKPELFTLHSSLFTLYSSGGSR